MPKTYEQRQLVELRDWESSSRERPAIGPRKGNEVIVNLDAAWCLDCGADARLALFVCPGSHKSSSWKAECCFRLRRPRLWFLNLLTGEGWKLQTEVSPPNSALGRRLDGDWTSFNTEPLPIRAMLLPSGMDGERPAHEIRQRKAKQKHQR